MIHLLFARHGESRWQVVGDEAGPDSPLTELGCQQADLLGQWLATDEVSINCIYASPLKRARKTAQLVNAHLNLPLHFHEGLKEAWFFVAPESPSFSWSGAILDNLQPDGELGSENYWSFRSQVAGALRKILSEHQEGTILIVAHGGTIEMAIRLLTGGAAFTVNMGNTTLHSLLWRGERWHIEYVDRWEHLREMD